MITAGLDEAGRGPILGPLVLCGASFREADLLELRRMGVRDSKLLSPASRERLFDQIMKLAVRVEFAEVWPDRLDQLMAEKNLNEIEAEFFSRIIDRVKPSVAYVDSPDPRPQLFEERLRRYLKTSPRLVVENGADRKYVQVSAASILAKVRRDRRIKELHEKFGDFGSGYLTDPRTVSFLREWVKVHGTLPDFARKSWKWRP
jgi:ribonuclease HII